MSRSANARGVVTTASGALQAAARRLNDVAAVVRVAIPPVRGFVPLLVLLALWQLSAVGGPSPYLPPPSAWWAELQRWYGEGLAADLVATLQTFLVGLSISTVLGTILGLAIGTIPIVGRALSTILEFLRTLPAPVVIPIALLLFGPGEGTKLFAVVFAAVWPVLMNTASASRHVSPTLVEVSRIFRLSRLDYIRKVALPASLPYILVGVRVAVPVALIVTILVEMLVSTPGIGRDLMHAQRSFRSASAFGLLFVIAVLGYVVNVGFLIVQGLVLRRWPHGADPTGAT